jgi:L-ascorbate metabolism protein UlaG (beta-lactamase superfamily)
MEIRLIRHATLKLDYAGHTMLVDPMLSPAGAMAPIQDSPNQKNNPLVELPIAMEEVLKGVQAILVTHTHRDHWDDAATKLVPKDMRLFIQPEDAAYFAERKFTNVHVIDKETVWQRLDIHRTGGEHGTGEIGKAMSPVSGYVLRAMGEPTLYIAGDTIWCASVSDALTKFQPDVVVVNAGAARFLKGEPITMSTDDVVDVCQAAPGARVIAVHMEAINHCLLTRAALRAQLKGIHVDAQVEIPADGQTVSFSS